MSARVERSAAGSLLISYVLEGALSQLRIPAPRPPREAANLWQHTCFEMFIAERGLPAYHELNFSPSGEWAVYSFSGYRLAAPPAAPIEAPRTSVQRTDERLQLDAAIHLDALVPPGAPLAVGITAVIEDGDGALSYWALRHSPGKPDFHRAETFTLEIDAARH